MQKYHLISMFLFISRKKGYNGPRNLFLIVDSQNYRAEIRGWAMYGPTIWPFHRLVDKAFHQKRKLLVLSLPTILSLNWDFYLLKLSIMKKVWYLYTPYFCTLKERNSNFFFLQENRTVQNLFYICISVLYLQHFLPSSIVCFTIFAVISITNLELFLFSHKNRENYYQNFFVPDFWEKKYEYKELDFSHK